MLFSFVVTCSLAVLALAASPTYEQKLAGRATNYHARIGHAGGPHGKRKLARGRARRRVPIVNESPSQLGVVHLPIQPVAARDAHSYKKHRHHAVHRHRAIMAVKNSTSSSDSKASSGASQKEVNAALQDTITDPSGTPATNSLGLSIEGADVGYFANITIGTPGKTFRILMVRMLGLANLTHAGFWLSRLLGPVGELFGRSVRPAASAPRQDGQLVIQELEAEVRDHLRHWRGRRNPGAGRCDDRWTQVDRTVVRRDDGRVSAIQRFDGAL